VGLNDANESPYFKLQKSETTDSQFRTLPFTTKHKNNVRHSYTETDTKQLPPTAAHSRMSKVNDEKKYKNGICVKQFDMVSTCFRYISYINLTKIGQKRPTSENTNNVVVLDR
jgi:hypothetical protein